MDHLIAVRVGLGNDDITAEAYLSLEHQISVLDEQTATKELAFPNYAAAYYPLQPFSAQLYMLQSHGSQ